MEPLVVSEETRGLVATVCSSFMTVHTDDGDVYVPPDIAVPLHLEDISPTALYSSGELVVVRMVKQIPVVEGCSLRAVNIKKLESESEASRPSSSQDVDDEPVVEAELTVQILRVHKTFAFAENEKHGSIFVPGNAFHTPKKDLTDYLQANDELVVTITQQSLRNSCWWIAISAAKKEKMKAMPPVGEIITACGEGVITELNDYSCRVLWNQIPVICSIMTYIGGDGMSGAEYLTDVLKEGDEIAFEAYGKVGENVIRASKWHLYGYRPELIPKYRERIREVATQTVNIDDYLDDSPDTTSIEDELNSLNI